MKRDLSISRAWDETKARIAADGRLFVAVALALVALPSAIGQFVTPTPASGEAGLSATQGLVMIAVLIVTLIGQLALIRLALAPGVTVGEAIRHAARRSPIYLVTVILVIIAAFLLLIPFGGILVAMGFDLQPGTPPPASAWIVILLALAVVAALSVRMMMTSPVASEEAVGPIGIIKRSWELTRGHGWRLLGFLLLVTIGFLILLAAVSAVIGLVVSLLFGPPGPLSAGALIMALVEAIVTALWSTVFVVMLARIYVQLAGEEGAEVSVPSSGT